MYDSIEASFVLDFVDLARKATTYFNTEPAYISLDADKSVNASRGYN